MNGRIYDPALARIMTADPFLQSPNNLQSHNRYSYVLNSPLMYTDPSGYFPLKKLVKNKIVRIAVAVAISVYAPQMMASNFGRAGTAWGASEFAAAGYSLTTAGAMASSFAVGFVANGGNRAPRAERAAHFRVRVVQGS